MKGSPSSTCITMKYSWYAFCSSRSPFSRVKSHSMVPGEPRTDMFQRYRVTWYWVETL